jgi:hypothetical protein
VRLTADATYQGLPLTGAAWEAHLELLRTVAAGASPDLMAFDLAGHQAWVSLGQCRLVHDIATPSTDGSFVWARWALTELGRVYLEQRTEPACSPAARCGECGACGCPSR